MAGVCEDLDGVGLFILSVKAILYYIILIIFKSLLVLCHSAVVILQVSLASKLQLKNVKAIGNNS